MDINEFFNVICRANDLPANTELYIDPNDITLYVDELHTWEFRHCYYFDDNNTLREIDISKAFSVQKDFNNPASLSPIPILQNTLPDTQTMPNNKLANELQKGLVNDGANSLLVAAKKKHLETYAVISLNNSDEEPPLYLDTDCDIYTEYDRQVMDSIISLYLSGEHNHTFTPETLYRTMTHKKAGETPSKEQIQAITNSINKLRRIHAYVDATEEIKKRKIKDAHNNPIDKFVIDDYLLNCIAVTVRAGGKTVQAYKVLSEPILYTYSALVKQLITIPAKLLDIRTIATDSKPTKALSNTPGRIAIKGYLLRRISIIKRSPRSQANIILFDTLFQACGQATNDRIAKKRNCDYIFQCLDYWQAQEFIIDYEKISRKKVLTGIKIIV